MPRKRRNLFLGDWTKSARGVGIIGNVFLILIAVKDLARSRNMIPLLLKPHRQQSVFRRHIGFGEVGRQKVNPSTFRIEGGHHTGPRGIADRCLAMGIIKKHTPGSQPVDIRSLSLGVTTQATDPIIKIINGDQQNIGPAFFHLLIGK